MCGCLITVSGGGNKGFDQAVRDALYLLQNLPGIRHPPHGAGVHPRGVGLVGGVLAEAGGWGLVGRRLAREQLQWLVCKISNFGVRDYATS